MNSFLLLFFVFFFFFNDTATTEIYTLSLHDALPICADDRLHFERRGLEIVLDLVERGDRSEEHTSELQSQSNLVCRLLLEKKKKKKIHNNARKQKKYKCTHLTHRQHN